MSTTRTIYIDLNTDRGASVILIWDGVRQDPCTKAQAVVRINQKLRQGPVELAEFLIERLGLPRDKTIYQVGEILTAG